MKDTELTLIERLAQYASANRFLDKDWKNLVREELETEEGKHDPAMENFIRKLHKKFPNLNMDWLLTGRGTMRYNEQSDVEIWRTRFYELIETKYEDAVIDRYFLTERLRQNQFNEGQGLYIQRHPSKKEDDFESGFENDEEAKF